jgi:hypothetical protein
MIRGHSDAAAALEKGLLWPWVRFSALLRADWRKAALHQHVRRFLRAHAYALPMSDPPALQAIRADLRLGRTAAAEAMPSIELHHTAWKQGYTSGGGRMFTDLREAISKCPRPFSIEARRC